MKGFSLDYLKQRGCRTNQIGVYPLLFYTNLGTTANAAVGVQYQNIQPENTNIYHGEQNLQTLNRKNLFKIFDAEKLSKHDSSNINVRFNNTLRWKVHKDKHYIDDLSLTYRLSATVCQKRDMHMFLR